VQSKIPEPANESSGGCCYEDGCKSCNPAGHFCDSESACSNECKGHWCGADSEGAAALVQSKIPEPANESSAGEKDASAAIRLPNNTTFSEWCFCLYTSQCLDHFGCEKGDSLGECQNRSCGKVPLYLDSTVASFNNYNAPQDILTIPRHWYSDIYDLRDRAADPVGVLRELLEVGLLLHHAIYGNVPIGEPFYQCVHMIKFASVRWLHIHTLNGSIPEELVPTSLPYGVCVNASTSTPHASATHMMSVLPPKV